MPSDHGDEESSAQAALEANAASGSNSARNVCPTTSKPFVTSHPPFPWTDRTPQSREHSATSRRNFGSCSAVNRLSPGALSPEQLTQGDPKCFACLPPPPCCPCSARLRWRK